jgi:hypothetical protein
MGTLLLQAAAGCTSVGLCIEQSTVNLPVAADGWTVDQKRISAGQAVIYDTAAQAPSTPLDAWLPPGEEPVRRPFECAGAERLNFELSVRLPFMADWTVDIARVEARIAQDGVHDRALLVLD